MAAPPTASSLRHQLYLLDVEITVTQTRLSQLAAARRDVAEKLQEIPYEGIVALPVEITEEIFTQAVEKLEIGGVAPLLMPLVLASVCRAWRRIALNLSTIWSKLVLAQGDDIDPPWTAEFIRILFARAKNRPLELEVYNLTETTFFDIFPLLCDYSAQWSKFGCHFDQGNEPPSTLFDAVHGKLPNLRALELRGVYDSIDGLRITTFKNAPKLREICLSMVPLSLVDLPWGQLTKVSYSGLDIWDSVEILEAIVNVEHLTLHVFELPGDSQWPRPEPIELVHLHTLHLEYKSDSALMGTDALIAPAMQHLHADFDPVSLSDAAASRIADLLDRSQCTLLSLSLNHVTVDAVLYIVRRTPSLTELTIQDLVDFRPNLILSHILFDGASLCHLRRLHVQLPALSMPYVEITRFLAARGGNGQQPDSDSDLQGGASDTGDWEQNSPVDAGRFSQLEEISFIMPTPVNEQKTADAMAELAGMLPAEWPPGCSVSIVGPHGSIRSKLAPTGTM
ncbi:hypothetical protein C8F01DRAFT_562461 [Mycena amicta]|nr:hypothetical protein C8F01DRAFT_562461 [Mycena amicta]